MNSGRIVIGVMAGFVAGVMLGVLFAPEKGAITRRRISRKGQEYTDDLEEKLDDFLEGITQKMEDVKSGTKNILKNGAKKADHTIADIEKRIIPGY